MRSCVLRAVCPAVNADQALGPDDAESGWMLSEAPWALKVRNTAGDWFTAQWGSDGHRQELVFTDEDGVLHPVFLFLDLGSITVSADSVM